MDTAHPHYDIQIGETRFSRHPQLHGLIRRITLNKSNDKVATRGKKRVKRNRCDLEFSNPDGVLNNLLRMGHKIRVWGGYRHYPLIHIGSYQLENPRWVFNSKGSHVIFRGLGGDGKMYYEKGARQFRGKTRTEVIQEICLIYGYRAEVFPLPGEVKAVYLKPSGLSDYEWVEEHARDAGCDFWPDDSTEPPTIIFRPAVARDIQSVTGQRVTVGFGPGTKATVPANELAVEHRYPVPLATSGQRKDDGQASFGSNLRDRQTHGLRGPGTGNRTEVMPKSRGTTQPGEEKHVLEATAGDGVTKRIMEATFIPGIPFFRLDDIIPLIGMGDLSGNYRIVDITHTFTKSSFETRVKAILGGLSGAKRVTTTKGSHGSNLRSRNPVQETHHLETKDRE